MKKKTIENLAINIVDPSTKAYENQMKIVPGKYFSHPAVHTAYAYPLKFIKLNPNKGAGRFLLAINNFPGLTKSQLFEKIFGPNYTGAAFAETFTKLKAAQLIENHRPGFFITPLGQAVLKQHNLI